MRRDQQRPAQTGRLDSEARWASTKPELGMTYALSSGSGQPEPQSDQIVLKLQQIAR